MENIKEINGVKYNADLVKEYEENYIMEEEGIGADPKAEPYDTQTKLNEVPFEEMIEEGEVEIDD
jgi:hypothetical protein